jgi:hypothetical protein
MPHADVRATAAGGGEHGFGEFAVLGLERRAVAAVSRVEVNYVEGVLASRYSDVGFGHFDHHARICSGSVVAALKPVGTRGVLSRGLSGKTG